MSQLDHTQPLAVNSNPKSNQKSLQRPNKRRKSRLVVLGIVFFLLIYFAVLYIIIGNPDFIGKLLSDKRKTSDLKTPTATPSQIVVPPQPKPTPMDVTNLVLPDNESATTGIVTKIANNSISLEKEGQAYEYSLEPDTTIIKFSAPYTSLTYDAIIIGQRIRVIRYDTGSKTITSSVVIFE